MKKILLWGVILGFLALPSAHALPSITGIDWNGEYWLMGTTEGDIVKYDGERFSSLANLGCTTTAIRWAEGYWLMGCRKVAPGYPGKKLDMLLIYDGEKFTDLSIGYAPQKIACSGEYCLLFGGAKDERLMKYDGAQLTDLTQGFQEAASSPWINEMLWNGEYWLITTSEDLVKYDGSAFTEIDIGELSVSTLGWDGNYWLVVLTETQGIAPGQKPRLFKYGKTLNEITLPQFFNKTELGREGMGYLVPREVVWNGKYWLMSTGFPLLIRYDGDAFQEIPLPIKEGVSDIAWNGEYWLLSYPASPGNLRFLRYDGTEFTELDEVPEYALLTIFGWTGEYWLIGSVYSSPFGMLKYDGNAVTDLTGGFMHARQAAPPSPTPRPPPGYVKVIFGLLFLAIVAVLVFLWKAKSRGALLGAIWGLVGPISYWALAEAELYGVKTLLLIIALPVFVYSTIFIPEAAPGGSFYYSPIIVFPFSIALGALIGYAAGKAYGKIKAKRAAP